MMDSPDYNTIFAFKTKQLAITIIKNFQKSHIMKLFG